MTTVTFNNGATGTIIQVLTRGNGDIRPPYHLEGALVVRMNRPYIGYVTVLPEGMQAIYDNEAARNQVTIT